MIITILRQIWYNSTTLAWLSQIKYFFKRYHFFYTKIEIRYFKFHYIFKKFKNKIIFSLQNFLECNFFAKWTQKTFLKIGLFQFYSIFKPKIILWEVILIRKMAFQSTPYKIWTYKWKNFLNIFLELN
jgi:hypothetical protein